VFVVDTNVLVYASDEHSPFHRRCREHVEAWRGGASAWYVTWGIVYEFIRVVTHRKILVRPVSAVEGFRFVEALLASPGFGILRPTERHAAVAAETFLALPQLAGNLIHDAHTAVLMREHGIRRIYTRDADFHRFRFLEVVDPVATAS